MGGHPYFYFTPYTVDPDMALQALRSREFKAGRYNPAMRMIDFPITADTPSPGARHATIEAALEASGADGTRSILDIASIGDPDDPGLCTATEMSEERYLELYGTTTPTHQAVADNLDILDELERGTAVYVLVYDAGRPHEYFFAGYSFD